MTRLKYNGLLIALFTCNVLLFQIGLFAGTLGILVSLLSVLALGVKLGRV